MIRFAAVPLMLSGLAALGLAVARADTPPAAARGRQALTGRAFGLAPWSLTAYDAAWKQWRPAPEASPADYGQAFRDYYGLHPAPYDNGRLPMGLREGRGLLARGLTTDCLVCHGGSILGKSYVGLGNASLDIEALFQDLARASGAAGKLPFAFSNVRGTTEAAAMAVYLHSFREPDLKLHYPRHDFPLRDELCEDTPAWWLLKKKSTMYYTGSTPARSVRSIMQFMLSPTTSAAGFEREEATFRDIQAYILSLEAPRYLYLSGGEPLEWLHTSRGTWPGW